MNHHAHPVVLPSIRMTILILSPQSSHFPQLVERGARAIASRWSIRELRCERLGTNT